MLSGKKLKTTKSKEKEVVAKTVNAKTAKMKNLKAKAKEVKSKVAKANAVKANTVKPKVTTTKVVKKTKVTKAEPKKVIGKLSEERQAFEKSINKGEFSILKTKQRGKRERNYLNELAKSLETTVKWFNRTKAALPELTSINLKFNGTKLTMK